MKLLDQKQLWAAAALAALSPLLRLVPGLNLRAAGAAGWLSGLTALPGLLGYGRLLSALLAAREADEPLAALLRRRLGRGAAVLCALWFVFYGGFLLRMGAERFLSALGVFTRWEPFALGLLLTAAAAAAAGQKPLGRAAQIFLPAVAGILLLVCLCALPELHLSRLRAVRLGSAPAVLRGAVPIWGIGAGTLFVLAFLAPPGAADRRRMRRWAVWLAVAASLISALAVGLLGAELTAHLSHPFFVLLRNLRLSRSLERMEAFIAAVWVLPDLVMTAALLLAGREALGGRVGVWPLAAGMLLVSLALPASAFTLAVWSETIVPILNAAVVLAVPALALARVRNEASPV